ncbi:MAG: hypothetical protein PHP67_08360, partial [Sphaerochaeta sp.]|nr:hypothetical protein [Sphaerochaeta sp.]
LAFTSCDASIRQDIAGFMGGFSGNVYTQSGAVEPSTPNADAIAELIEDTVPVQVTADDAADPFDTGVTIVLDGDVVILSPQTPAEQTERNETLDEAFSSPDETAALLEKMNEPATTDEADAVTGTVTVFNATIDAVIVDMGLDENDPDDAEVIDLLENLQMTIPDTSTITKGDVLVLQMMVDLVSSAVTTIDDIDTVDEDTLLALAADASFTANAALNLESATSIDFSGQLSLQELMNSFGN